MPLDPAICLLKNKKLWFSEYSYIAYSEGSEEFLKEAIIEMSELQIERA